MTQYHLVVGDFVMRKLQKKSKQLHAPKLKVWKLQDKNMQSRFAEALRAKGEAVTERSDVESKWEAMKSNWVKAAEEVCGWTKGAPRHRVTWWWNDNVAKAIEEKRRCFKGWHKSKDENDREAYREAKRLARKTVAVAQENERKELASELEEEEGKSNLFRIAGQMARERQDVVGVNCLRDPTANVVIGNNKIKDTWKSYMEKLLNVENAWDKDVSSGKAEGSSCRITDAEVEKAIGRMKKGKAAGPTGVVTEMLKASQEVGVQWLTDLSNRIIDEGRIPGDWEMSVIIPIYKGKGDPLECGSYRAVKLLEHAMKVVERVLEQRIRNQVRVDEMEFGFMPGKGTTDAIFLIKQLQEKYRGKGKKLYYAFVDLEKA
ncbi:hypothetical protein JGC18_24880, partial [Salmonella enterica subsp. enterica serovar Typhimurium]|nr:hypothetical protein [Salmonella enterica subsp. enterica serovar Typhimurium]